MAPPLEVERHGLGLGPYEVIDRGGLDNLV